MVVKHLGLDRLKGLFTVQITRMLCGSRSLKGCRFSCHRGAWCWRIGRRDPGSDRSPSGAFIKPVVKERCRQERKVQADRQGPRRWRCRRWSGFISSNTADGQYSRKSAPTNRRSALSRQGRDVKTECSAGRRTNAHRQRSQWFRLVKSSGTQSSSMNSVIPSTPTNNRKNCEHPQHDECRNSKKRHCTASFNGRSDHPTCRYKNAEAPTGAEAQT